MALFRVEMSKVFYVEAEDASSAERIARDNERFEAGSWEAARVCPGHELPEDWKEAHPYVARYNAQRSVKDLVDEINRKAKK